MAPRDDDAAASDGISGWLRRNWRAVVSELLATALLVGLGVGSAIPVHGPGPAPLTHPAFAFGCVVLANAMAFGPTSGAYMNPAVTLAGVAMRQLSPGVGAAYVLAQTAGAVLGFGALLAAVPVKAPAGCTLPGPGVPAVAAAAFEAVLTAVLVLSCCSVWMAPTPDINGSLKLGLVVAGLVYAGGEATGASLNPARSLAPALFHGVWSDHWVYWVGPVAGAAIAVLLYRYLLSPPQTSVRSDEAPEDVPLRDKP